MIEAEDWIKKTIEFDRQNGMMARLGKDYGLYSEWFKRTGNIKEAKKQLKKAVEILKDCGTDGWVEKYEKELAAL
jgi:phage tail tape-measure protein